ncbi:MAG: class I SAM-dependent methyltransferase [Scytolyngbya sp. HA4215-MV1]|jgi:trans-aconitate methyltransferase|nr:class I SAM-dependent methyltransferase [Scytolyngbya sp. HA4215-MV1]
MAQIVSEQTNAPLVRDWSTYYAAVKGRPPRETLLQTLDRFTDASIAPGFAVDLGCGDGRDTVELLRQGWQVLAIDGEATAIEHLQQRSDVNLEQLTTQIARFESLILPASVDLINASFCLPFCPPENFPTLWYTLVSSLKVGGRFCGQLFGDRDSWTIYSNMTFQTRKQIKQLLQPFKIEYLYEEDHPGVTALGEEKHWHIFHIVAQKQAAPG